MDLWSNPAGLYLWSYLFMYLLTLSSNYMCEIISMAISKAPIYRVGNNLFVVLLGAIRSQRYIGIYYQYPFWLRYALQWSGLLQLFSGCLMPVEQPPQMGVCYPGVLAQLWDRTFLKRFYNYGFFISWDVMVKEAESPSLWMTNVRPVWTLSRSMHNRDKLLPIKNCSNSSVVWFRIPRSPVLISWIGSMKCIIIMGFCVSKSRDRW